MTFAVVHAAWMLTLAALSWTFRDVRISAWGGVASLVIFVVRSAPHWTPKLGRFGLANAITALRLILLLGLAMLPVGPLSAVLLCTLLALDGLDGAVARRNGLASTFGASFDMETDALVILIATTALSLANSAFAFVLLTGWLRYVYVLVVHLFGAHTDAPRSRLGRYGFAALMTSLAASYVPVPGARLLALGPTVFVSYSFARSFWWAFRGPLIRERSTP